MYKTTALKCDRCPHLDGNVCGISRQTKAPNDTCNLTDDQLGHCSGEKGKGVSLTQREVK